MIKSKSIPQNSHNYTKHNKCTDKWIPSAQNWIPNVRIHASMRFPAVTVTDWKIRSCSRIKPLPNESDIIRLCLLCKETEMPVKHKNNTHSCLEEGLDVVVGFCSSISFCCTAARMLDCNKLYNRCQERSRVFWCGIIIGTVVAKTALVTWLLLSAWVLRMDIETLVL